MPSDDARTDEQEAENDTNESVGMRRRDVLNAARVAGVGAITAGFTGVTSAKTEQYVAAPVTLAAAGELGYDERNRGEAALAEVAPVGASGATLVNQFAEYVGNGAGLGLVATPAPVVDGQQLNPLARMSPGEILTGKANGVLLRHLAAGTGRWSGNAGPSYSTGCRQPCSASRQPSSPSSG
jgi:hypothetical protein